MIQGVIEVALSSYTNGSANYTEVLSLLWHPRAHFWFLYALFMVFLFSSSIFAFLSEKWSVPVFLLSFCAYLFQDSSPDIYQFKVIFKYEVFFMLGVVFMSKVNFKYFSEIPYLIFWFLMFIVFQWLFHFYLGKKYTDIGIVSFIVSVVSIALLVSISSMMSFFSFKSILLIGRSTMAIYLLHIIVGSGVRVILEKYFGVTDFWVHVLTGVGTGLLAPLFFVSIMEKLNVRYVFYFPISKYLPGQST